MTNEQRSHPTLALPVLILKCIPAILQGEAHASTASDSCPHFGPHLRPSDRHMRARATALAACVHCSSAAIRAALARSLAGLLPAALGIPKISAAVHAAPVGTFESRQLSSHRHAYARWKNLSLYRRCRRAGAGEQSRPRDRQV